MADFDIFNPIVSKVEKDLTGKLILVHSNENKVGKTFVGSQLPKPLYLRFEQGINAISGLKMMPLSSWADFKKVNKQLTNPKTLEEVSKMYSSIIFDTTDVAIKWCERYICNSQGVTRLNDGNSGYGLWKEYELEWFNEINKLINANFTVYFISHSEMREVEDGVTKEVYNKMTPKGDKRTIDLICDAVDFIGYVKSNGLDEEGNEILSSCYFANTREYKAGSRFRHMPKVIKEFTAENLERAIKYAIEMEEQESGIKAIERKDRLVQEVDKLSYDELLEAIKPIMQEHWKDKQQQVMDIVENYLGSGVKITDTTSAQILQLEMILYELKEL